jgi:hypothetical protein
MPVSLNVLIVDKRGLLHELKKILETDDYCGHETPDDDHLPNLLKNLKPNVWFTLEFPYVDKHYRDTYYSFHSSKYHKIGRECIRVHLFKEQITHDDLLNQKSDLRESYWGFFIVCPIARSILGRSLISPDAFEKNNFLCCLMKDRVSLLGNEFTVHGFPHVAQDTETHTCAESSLWSFMEYFGSKYHRYNPLLPSQIIKLLMDNSEHRVLPSEGLTETELAKCLQNNGFQCKIYKFNNPLYQRPVSRPARKFVQIYIESGMPLLLKLENNHAGHAVLAIGHEEDNLIYDEKNHIPLQYTYHKWVDVSSYPKKLVFIDDNMPPYQIADISQPTAHYLNQNLKDMYITDVIVSLPELVFLTAEGAYDLIKKILNTECISLRETGEKWITRLLLTSGHSFKNFVNKEAGKIVPSLKKALLHLTMPKYIWICELYRTRNFNKDNGYCSGLLIIDATSDGKLLSSVLWYTIDTRRLLHNGIVWNEEYEPIEAFEMNTYRYNLKGEWNGWKS